MGDPRLESDRPRSRMSRMGYENRLKVARMLGKFAENTDLFKSFFTCLMFKTTIFNCLFFSRAR